MNGTELSALMNHRWSILQELMDISAKQIEAIRAGRMAELMRILSDKQRPLGQLGEIAEAIRVAANDDPETRVWESKQARQACRQQQEECERIHLELLAIEAECETALQESRNNIQEKIQRVDAGKQAAASYAEREVPQSRGGRLDLSSD